MISSSGKKIYKSTFQTLHWLLSFILVSDVKIRCNIIASFFFTLLTIFFNTGIPFVFKYIITMFDANNMYESTMIHSAFLLYGFIWIMNQAMQQLSYVMIIPVLECSMRRLNLRIFDHLHSLSLRFHLDKKTGAITSAIDRTQSGFDAIFWALFLFVIPTTIEMIIIIAVFASLYGTDYSTILFCTAIGYFLFCSFCMTIFDALQATYNEKKSLASQTFVDSLLNVETVKYFNNRHYDYQQCNAILQQQEKTGIKLHFFSSFFQFGQKAIIGIGLIILTWKSGNAVLMKKMTVGDFVLINSYLLQFAAPLSNFGYIFRQIKKGLADMNDSIALLAIDPDIKDAPNAFHIKKNTVSISFDNVSFGYSQERTILKNISFAIPEGKTIALVGSTGSGKSTISKLLFRLYDVIDGAILFNNQDIRTITQESLHTAIGVVAQDTNLFNNTLYYNIAYARPNALQSEVEQAIKDAYLDEFVARLADGYNTIVGERGLKLSGGERQRVAIARVLLKKPMLYIFDEATSSVDNATERALQNSIRSIAQGKTTLIIAHRLSTIEYADEIIVLDKGKIIERGNHAQLLAHGGTYYNLWYNQEQKLY